MDITQAAKEIRAILKNSFPSVKFSVKSSRFSQGSSIDVSWVDGPTTDQVDALIGKYGDSRSRFIGTNRTHSRELVTQSIAVWRKQNPEYSHFTVTCQGETSCYAEFNMSEFSGGICDLRECESSLHYFLYHAAFDGTSLILPQENTDDCEPETVSAPELELVEIVTAPQPTNEVLITLTRIDGLTPEQHADETLATITATGWAQAESVIQQWANTVEGSFDTCDVTINFPGEQVFKTYNTRYNIEPFDAIQPKLLKYVKMELQFIAGQRPDDMEDEHYEAWKAYYQPADMTNAIAVNYLLKTFIYPAITALTSEFEFTVSEGSTCSHPEFNVDHTPTGYSFKVWKSATQKCWANTIYTLTEDRGYSYEYGFATPYLAAANAVERMQAIENAKNSVSTPVDRDLTLELIDLQELLISKLGEVNQLKLKIAELQVERDAAKYNKQQPKKAQIAQITLTRDEGTIAESGTSVIASGWLDAVRILKKWAATVSSPTRADKCRIVFEFSDGESFKLSSFGLKQEHRFKINLAQELLTELQHLAGEIIPAHMTQQDYEDYCKFCKIEPANYKRLLDNWDIPA